MSESNGNRILRPDQPQVGHISSNGPLELVQPCSAVGQGRDGVLFTSCGGLTKLEHAAIELAKHRQEGATSIVAQAKSILDECFKVQSESQKKSGTLQE